MIVSISVPVLALTLMTPSKAVVLVRECFKSSRSRSPSLLACVRGWEYTYAENNYCQMSTLSLLVTSPPLVPQPSTLLHTVVLLPCQHHTPSLPPQLAPTSPTCTPLTYLSFPPPPASRPHPRTNVSGPSP